MELQLLNSDVSAFKLTVVCLSLFPPDNLQGSRCRELGQGRLPDGRVYPRPHQMPVQQDLHLRRASAAS